MYYVEDEDFILGDPNTRSANTHDCDVVRRDTQWVFERAGGLYRMHAKPPRDMVRWPCLQYWITRIDLPLDMQISYHVYDWEEHLEYTYFEDVINQVNSIVIEPCTQCKVQPAIASGPCKTNHLGVCEWCHLLDPSDRNQKLYRKDNDDRTLDLNAAIKAYEDGHRFTLVIEGQTHVGCDGPCPICDARSPQDGQQREVVEVQHHFRNYPDQRSIDRHLKKHAFAPGSTVRVYRAKEWEDHLEFRGVYSWNMDHIFRSAQLAARRAYRG
ncbi:hypothetical protein [Limnohabitans sp.]|uniref:hypothetical protein n=1 Tax=Limnohabitans sp. TaxID=1907725 RepID=UPI002608B2BC|nr:hypothetical protein [Limnohabitans sp.]